MTDQSKLAALIERALMNTENRIVGDDALSLLGALQELQAVQTSAMERKNVLEADAKRDNLQRVDVTVRDLSFWQLYAFMENGRQFGCDADGEHTLTVYYSTDYSDDRPQLCLEEVVSPAPLVFVGEYCEHIIHAFQPLLFDMDEHLKSEIRELAEYAVCAQMMEAA